MVPRLGIDAVCFFLARRRSLPLVTCLGGAVERIAPEGLPGGERVDCWRTRVPRGAPEGLPRGALADLSLRLHQLCARCLNLCLEVFDLLAAQKKNHGRWRVKR